ncbi:hypothetical protein [Aromatoleum diolicum]|uniref:Uncharacterized protein n=1 Tax=Aromatoleum diolicum TaxID=75796 RepID=A0ABX1QG84_9RHOO|nr:hypothetical protein [Aromatoleum diolicum]NMG77464.1 hypothetical protein [Aromatoleum diolicum]
MATIVIKDLPENMDLDRQAMLAITGGARLRGRPAAAVRALARGDRSVDQPRTGPQAASRRPVKSTLFR